MKKERKEGKEGAKSRSGGDTDGIYEYVRLLLLLLLLPTDRRGGGAAPTVGGLFTRGRAYTYAYTCVRTAVGTDVFRKKSDINL